MEDRVEITCPYCGESIPVFVDPGDGSDERIEDCHVCCNPILLRVTVEAADSARVDAQPSA